MDEIISKIQGGSLPKTAILENLKLQLYSKYAAEVILNRCSAKEATIRISNGTVSKEITSSIINGIRNDISLQSPFRRINQKTRKPSTQAIQNKVNKIQEYVNNRNKNIVKQHNKNIASEIIKAGSNNDFVNNILNEIK